MTTIACVLRSGGVYDLSWVYALKRAVARHAGDYRFVCLTDAQGLPPVWTVPLEHNWPVWWAKLELFRPGVVEGPVLYLDLDTLPVGDLSDLLAYDGPFAMLSDFYRPHRAQSGVMAFTPGMLTEHLWSEFSRDPVSAMEKFRGDGEWLHAHAGDVARLQDLFPGQIVSFKVHAKRKAPEGARLVCGHGQPRFSDPAAGWAHKEWLRWAA